MNFPVWATCPTCGQQVESAEPEFGQWVFLDGDLPIRGCEAIEPEVKRFTLKPCGHPVAGWRMARWRSDWLGGEGWVVTFHLLDEVDPDQRLRTPW